MVHAKKYLISLCILIMIGCGESTRYNSQSSSPSLSIHTEVLDKVDPKEAKIVDGDTIKLTFDGKLTTIRLIGIDTFESRKNNKAYRQAYEHNITVEEVVLRGKRAKTYITNRLSKRVNLYLEYDEEFLDRYERTLGYVWFSDDDMLNLDIICDGYALPLTIKPNDKYAKAFQRCYEEAKAEKLGVWH
jgi:micrococcal nuclease